MNYPKYLARCPDMVCHPSSVLKEAAKAFRVDAAEMRKIGCNNDAIASERAAKALLEVASGSTWAEALCLQMPVSSSPTASQESAQSIKEVSSHDDET